MPTAMSVSSFSAYFDGGSVTFHLDGDGMELLVLQDAVNDRPYVCISTLQVLGPLEEVHARQRVSRIHHDFEWVAARP